jgi:hypothetical protein
LAVPSRSAHPSRSGSSDALPANALAADPSAPVAGYSVLECAGLDEAIEVSSRHPTARIGTFEFRAFQELA